MNNFRGACATTLTLSLLVVLGCGTDLGPPEDPVFQPYWTPLFLPGNDFVTLVIEDDALFVAERTAGVYVQRPAFSGNWRYLRFDLDDLRNSFQSYGITSLAVDDGRVVVGLNLPLEDERARLYHRLPDDEGWTAASFDPQSLVQDLITDGFGNVIGLDRNRTFSSQDGVNWTRSDQDLLGLEIGKLFVGPDGLYCGGHGPTREPKLYRSSDVGDSWDVVSLARSLDVPVGTIYAVTGYQDTEPAFLFTVDADVYRSDDGGKSFYHLLEIPRTPGQIHLNPADSQEFMIVGGWVFWTLDGGISWDIFALPRGLPARRSVVDWGARKLAVTTSDGSIEAVYAFDMDVAADFMNQDP